MIARNKNIHSQSSSNLKKSHSKSMAIKIADSAIIDLVQLTPPGYGLGMIVRTLGEKISALPQN